MTQALTDFLMEIIQKEEQELWMMFVDGVSEQRRQWSQNSPNITLKGEDQIGHVSQILGVD